MKLASESSLPTLLSVGEAAQTLGLSELTIRRMCRDGRLRSGRLGLRPTVSYASAAASSSGSSSGD
jgi:excisionase family DNA binding protein